MIDLKPEHLAIVAGILKREIPELQVYAFGSRVNGTASRFSDLDLAVLAPEPLTLTVCGRLQEAFSESDLPIRVDVIDFHQASPEFQDVIRAHLVQIQPHPVSEIDQGNDEAARVRPLNKCHPTDGNCQTAASDGCGTSIA